MPAAPETAAPAKVIISDTSCLIGLTNSGHLDALRRLYGTVIVTPEVAGEYGVPLPLWISVQAAADAEKVAEYQKFLDLGESSSIALAVETGNALVILDERRARQFALELGLEITGTLGVLIRAHEKGVLPDIAQAVADLRKTDFRLPANTEELLKARFGGGAA